MTLADGRTTDVVLVKSGLFFKKGDTMLSFDLHTGDQLFVDRMSYHFVKPKVGDGFVFKTGEVDGLKSGRDSFYIKRLSGVEGDSMRIEDGKLFVNEEEPTGSVAFGYNNGQVPPYDGYLNLGNRLLRRGETITVPEGMHVALGDNSGNSSDSRAWGYVPEKAIVGRPVMIFYPFTKRFGLAK
jgi:signal peptidase I